ncbi:hypothetical protein HMPREF0379_1500 [[Eubacterium] yurii subsp. margaretiae ATCC 43715]|nr:hypothetical protein HMPREF0379_1500 [[Eubacterium] yurii subsp. margaretiae ATCC 43715]
MKQTKKFSRKFSLLTIFLLLMSIITMDVYAAKLPFTDVPEKAWYYDDVKSAYESDLISGKKPTKYAPNDNMTAAEAVKLAAAMYKLRNEGSANFATSKPWYKVYVDYARQKALISSDLNWNKNITRAGYMQIFAQILTDEEAKKNSVADDSIPDVPMTHPNAQAIYKLYRAGIVTGIDERNSCSPGSNIKRSEVAAILIRMMDAKYRVTFSLGTTPGGSTPPVDTTPLKIIKQPENAVNRRGQKVTLEVAVEGGKPPYSYQWQHRYFRESNYTNSSAAGNTTNILKPTVDIGVFYRCVITDANGDKVTSNLAKVEADDFRTPLKITKQPENVKGKVGDKVTLSIQVSGGKEPYTYKWYCKGTGSVEEGYIGDGETAQPEILNNIVDFKCVVIDARGSKVTSSWARVEAETVLDPLTIIKQPDTAKGKLGELMSLEVQVKGGKEPYSYQWQYRNGKDINYTDSTSGGNKTNILNPPVKNEIYFYRCVITDANGNKVTSQETFVYEDLEELKITGQPDDIMGNVGDFALMIIEVSGGKPPYKYQWYYKLDGTAGYNKSFLEGSTTNRIQTTIINTIVFYQCVVTDMNGNQIKSREIMIRKK